MKTDKCFIESFNMLTELPLNQFERDWALAPSRDKGLDFKRISNSNVVISGNSMISRSIALSFLSLNDLKKLNNKIFVLYEDSSDINHFAVFSDREDFKILPLLKFNETSDIWIETNFLLPDSFQSVEEGKMFIEKANGVVSILSKVKPEKCILLSDTSVYGKLPRGFVASEYETGNLDFSENNYKTLVAQSLENLFFSAAHQYSFAIKVIRCASLICTFSDSRFIASLIKKVAENGEFNFKNKSDNVSYLYINDFLTALFYVIVFGKSYSIYNACSDGSTVSSAELAAVICQLFEDCDVVVSKDGAVQIGCAINNTKLKGLGWKPQVNIKDALLISKYAYLNSNEVFMFPDAYDGKLSSIQEILLGFLKEIDRICKKHNIKYFLGGGSLLGAIRHHGFIPWDDDADVMMLREDYDKFLKVLPEELPRNLSIQNNNYEKTSHFPFTKIRINNTVFSTEFTSRFSDIHNGIFLDVLAQDYTSDNSFISKLHMHAAASARWLVLNKWRDTPVNANSKFSSAVANFLKKIFPLRFLEFVQNKLISLYKSKNNGKYLFDSMGRNITRGAFPKEWLDEVVWVDFEDIKLPVPKEYDKYLTYLYGDYMNMIPVSQRHVSHDIIQIDLGEYTDYQLRKN